MSAGVSALAACGRSHADDTASPTAGGASALSGEGGLGSAARLGGSAGRSDTNSAAGQAGAAGRPSQGGAGSTGRGGSAAGNASTSMAGGGLNGIGGLAGVHEQAGRGGMGGLGARAGAAGAGAQAGGNDDAGAAGTGAAVCMLDEPVQVCGRVAPSNPLIDFATFQSNGRWGGAVAGALAGGTLLYHASGTQDFTFEASNGELHVSGLVPSHGTSGIALSFDPCVNLGNSTVVNVPLSSDSPNVDFKIVARTNTDYPIDVTNRRGACALIDCETKQPVCRFPSIAIPAEFVQVMGFQFSGGAPADSAGEFSDVVGLAFEATCSSPNDCPVSFTIGSIDLQPL